MPEHSITRHVNYANYLLNYVTHFIKKQITFTLK